MTVHRPFETDTALLGLPAIVVHGGAGTFERVHSDEDAAALREGLGAALAAGWEVLARGAPALDAVVEAVASLEDGGLFNAGRGAVPTSDGGVELDASVMDGATGLVAGICAATYPANPVRAARALASTGGLPVGPILLAGAGADRFCAEHDLAPRGGPPGSPALSGAGTVGAVAVDASARVAAATSTGGRSGQRLGRVGDSPIPGAGVWATPPALADPAGPGGVGVSATGEGEVFLVVGFAHRVAWQVAAGAPLALAVESALGAVGALGGVGGAIALGGSGELVSSFSTEAMARGWRSAAGSEVRIFRAEPSR